MKTHIVYIIIILSTLPATGNTQTIPEIENSVTIEGTKCAAKFENEPQEGISRAKCRNAMIPRQPYLSVSIPGSYFVGTLYNEGFKTVYGPQAGVDFAFTIPVRRPYLTYEGNKDNFDVFSLPTNMSFVFDISFALNANIASLKIEDKEVNYSGGLYIAPELGWMWWKSADSIAQSSSLKLVPGIFIGYAVGDTSGLLIGFQPGIKFTM